MCQKGLPIADIVQNHHSMADYIGHHPVKLRMLAEFCKDIVIKNGRKLLILHDWHVTLWLVEVWPYCRSIT